MKPGISRWALLAILLVISASLAILLATAPKHPVALIRVVDAATNGIAGAVILPEGLRTKSGPYVSGWYSWMVDRVGVTNSAAITDADGYARVPYPKYVFERIETGTLCLSVNHPDYVPARPERRVALAPPAGAPWRIWADYAWYRIQHKALIAQTEPIVLEKGAALKITVDSTTTSSKNARWFAQASGAASEDTNFWSQPTPGVLLTRQLATGPHTVRAVEVDQTGSVWFSDIIPITAVTGETNEVVLNLKRGATVRGQLDPTVPRPIKRGRVVANVWPLNCKPDELPPQWHAWTEVNDDGTFAIDSLPDGDLEIVALCDGFISTNGPGKAQTRYPQKYLLGTNDIDITVGMEPTARLEVAVTDEAGQPLKAVRVMTWPNVRYGEWGSTIVMSDCYRTQDLLQKGPSLRALAWREVPLDFEGVSDSAGIAVLPNLPANVTELSVEHPQFALPPIEVWGGRKEREARFVIVAGQTNRLTLHLEPREREQIRHY